MHDEKKLKCAVPFHFLSVFVLRLFLLSGTKKSGQLFGNNGCLIKTSAYLPGACLGVLFVFPFAEPTKVVGTWKSSLFGN